MYNNKILYNTTQVADLLSLTLSDPRKFQVLFSKHRYEYAKSAFHISPMKFNMENYSSNSSTTNEQKFKTVWKHFSIISKFSRNLIHYVAFNVLAYPMDIFSYSLFSAKKLKLKYCVKNCDWILGKRNRRCNFSHFRWVVFPVDFPADSSRKLFQIYEYRELAFASNFLSSKVTIIQGCFTSLKKSRSFIGLSDEEI